MTQKVIDNGFGAMLRELRQGCGLTQQQLADFSMVSVRGIRNLELGHARKPRKETIRLIADGLRLNTRERRVFERAASRVDGAEDSDGGLESAEPPGFVPRCALVGRDAEVASLVETLRGGEQRLMTVTGLPGVGKSHLALSVVEGLHASGGHTVLWAGHSRVPRSWCVSGPVDRLTALAQKATVDLVEPGPATAGSEGVDELAATLRGRRALMVVDGVPPRSLRAPQVGRLLRRCPELSVLVTSTDAQSVPVEHSVHLAPLPLPAPPCGSGGTSAVVDTVPSASLFLRQVRALGAEVAHHESFFEEVVRVCLALDGVPGALEAAATWLPVLGTTGLADLADRDPLTVLSPLSADPGQPCMRDALVHGVERLGSDERRALESMCAEPGPTAVERVMPGERLSLVERAKIVRELAVRGLVRRSRGASGASFEPLNLVRATVVGNGGPAAPGEA